jgi:hypothetical protein
MRVLLVHPGALMYSEIFLRLEPLGLEQVAAASLADGWKFDQVYNADRQNAEHLREAGYLLVSPADRPSAAPARK